MNIDLTGQTAVVTGAGHGTGLAVTRALTASGAHVIAGTRHSCAELDRLAAEGTVTTFEVALPAARGHQPGSDPGGGASRSR
jgi:NAD(P)-dependent dehydrogenase (short-subunit alcohol dehydrogenase family)